jgi:NTE family protein
MSSSFPFFFDPVILYRDKRPHLIVDGGLISNFPVWLFDSTEPSRRWTLGFRLHAGIGPHEPPYRTCRRPFWQLPLARAMFQTVMEAWDLKMSTSSKIRTISIPTGSVRTLQFKLSEEDRRELYESGYRAAAEFFEKQHTYLNIYGQQAAGPAAVRGSRLTANPPLQVS